MVLLRLCRQHGRGCTACWLLGHAQYDWASHGPCQSIEQLALAARQQKQPTFASKRVQCRSACVRGDCGRVSLVGLASLAHDFGSAASTYHLHMIAVQSIPTDSAAKNSDLVACNQSHVASADSRLKCMCTDLPGWCMLDSCGSARNGCCGSYCRQRNTCLLRFAAASISFVT